MIGKITVLLRVLCVCEDSWPNIIMTELILQRLQHSFSGDLLPNHLYFRCPPPHSGFPLLFGDLAESVHSHTPITMKTSALVALQ